MNPPDYKVFLRVFFKELEKREIDYTQFYIDHLGYQAATVSEYDALFKLWSDQGTFIDEKLVGGRRVGIFSFQEPYRYNNQSFNIAEIIEPKPDQNLTTGAWDHAELYLDGDIESIIAQYPLLPWITSKLNREAFPHLILPLTHTIKVQFSRLPILKELDRQRKEGL